VIGGSFRNRRGITDTEKKEGLMKEQVEKALAKIRPSLQADGGDVELVEVKDGVVKVKLKGSCAGCPVAQMTLKQGIERTIKQQVPEVKEVVAV
jgi:Fe-S cluster biogenesis protein NfuA